MDNNDTSFVVLHCAAIIFALCASSDNQMVAVGLKDNTVRTYKAGKGGHQRAWSADKTLQGHTDSVRCVAFAGKKDEHILSGSDDKTVRCWHAATGVLYHVFKGHRCAVHSLATFDDEARDVFVSIGDGKQLIMWNVAAKRKIASAGAADVYASLAVRGGGGSGGDSRRHVATGQNGTNKIIIWTTLPIRADPAALLLVKHQTFSITHDDTSRPYALSYSKDGALLAAGTNTNLIRVFHVGLRSYFPLRTLDTKDLATTRLCFLGNAHSLLAACLGRLVVLNTDDGTIIRAIKQLRAVTMYVVAAAPDGSFVAGCCPAGGDAIAIEYMDGDDDDVKHDSKRTRVC